MSEQSHQSDPRILSVRTLEKDHRRLLPLLQPGMAVLDVGCGTGAITAGIAMTVGPAGRVLGVDRDASLLAIARETHGGIPGLTFDCADALALDYDAVFDIVTAARALQWMSDPAEAIRRMRQTAKPGGILVVLDYNHLKNTWEPEPPPAFMRFYSAFLDWRDANGWDNLMGDHLPELVHQAGLTDVQVYCDDETCRRGDPDFAQAAGIWGHVIQSIGPRMVTDGFLDPRERDAAERCCRQWADTTLQRQSLELRAITGKV